RAGRDVEWLDDLLGRNRLVRCAWRFCLAAVGLVGSGTRVRSTTDKVAISLADIVRLSARHRWISLHRSDAGVSGRVARRSIARRNEEPVVDLANVVRGCAW